MALTTALAEQIRRACAANPDSPFWRIARSCGCTAAEVVAVLDNRWRPLGADGEGAGGVPGDDQAEPDDDRPAACEPAPPFPKTTGRARDEASEMAAAQRAKLAAYGLPADAVPAVSIDGRRLSIVAVQNAREERP